MGKHLKLARKHFVLYIISLTYIREQISIFQLFLRLKKQKEKFSTLLIPVNQACKY